MNRVAVENRFYYQNHFGIFDGNMASFVEKANHVTGEFDMIGSYVYNDKRLRNNYVAFENVLAGYILFDGIFSKKFRLNVGVRTEWTRNKVSINDKIGINYGVGFVHGIPNLDTTWNAGQDYVLPFVSASMHY